MLKYATRPRRAGCGAALSGIFSFVRAMSSENLLARCVTLLNLVHTAYYR
jgi:hypothetical protein